MRRLASTIVALALAGSAAGQTRPAAAPTVKLWRLDCGSFTAPKANFSDLLSGSGERAAYVNSCYLVRRGGDLMLWEAGFPTALLGKPEDASEPVRPRLTTTIADQLRRLGYEPSDVTVIGVSHLHSDHTGQAASFPRARLIMDRRDFEALARAPVPPFADPATLRPWLGAGAAKTLITGDHDVFGDGSVVMVALPGHTHGNHGLLVRLARTGPLLFSGDALHTSEQLTKRTMWASSASRADSLASIDRVAGIVRESRAKLVIQHDAASVAELPAFPEPAE